MTCFYFFLFYYFFFFSVFMKTSIAREHFRKNSVQLSEKTAARGKVVMLKSNFSSARVLPRALSSSLKVGALSQERVRRVSLQCGAHFSSGRRLVTLVSGTAKFRAAAESSLQCLTGARMTIIEIRNDVNAPRRVLRIDRRMIPRNV